MRRRPFALSLLLTAFALPLSVAGTTAPETYRFAPGEEIMIWVEDGAIRLRSIRFTGSESKLHASVLAVADEGKDQIVKLEITLLDANGQTVGVLKGKGKVEEEDKAKIKADAPLPTDRQVDIANFQVAVSAYPD
jgi:hypothetical protein